MAITAEQRRRWQAHVDAIRNCGNCGRSQSAHQAPGQEDLLEIMGALGACTHFVVSQAALNQIRRQNRAPKNAPRCQRCNNRGHLARNCPW